MVAILLGYASLYLLASKHVLQANWTCRGIIAVTALVSFEVNLAAGLAAGLIIELVRSLTSEARQPTV